MSYSTAIRLLLRTDSRLSAYETEIDNRQLVNTVCIEYNEKEIFLVYAMYIYIYNYNGKVVVQMWLKAAAVHSKNYVE